MGLAMLSEHAPGNSKPYAIRVEGLTKSYRNYHNPINRLIEIFAPHKTGLYSDFFALQGVTFDIARGESVAIVGRNGSGKSTLLQLICETIKPSAGQVRTFGKIAALLELGAGFDPEFTGLENMQMTAALYGVTDAQLKDKTQQILDFADIGEFIHQPVKTYSTGMVVRLAFAVIAHVDAEILIIDEALAVGDAIFTQKCMRYIREFKEKGTLLFVSHDMAAVQNLCDRAIWLDRGQIRMIGSAKSVAESYLQYSLQQVAGDDIRLESLAQDTASTGWKTGYAQITKVELFNRDDVNKMHFEGGEKVRLCIHVESEEPLAQPIIGFLFRDRLGQDLFGENTLRLELLGHTPHPVSGKKMTASFDFTLPYLPNGEYAVACSIADGDLHDNIQHHFIHNALIMTVSSSVPRWGLVGIVCDQITLEQDHG